MSWEILAATIVAALAWLYQRAWERQERRAKSYEAILDALPGFFVGSTNHTQIDTAIVELRRLMLYAPDSVIVAADEFLESVEGFRADELKEARLDRLVAEMRRDCSFHSALFPRFLTTELPSTKLVRRVSKKLPSS